MFVSTPLLSNLVNSGGKIIYESLIKNKVKDIFIYSGGSIMPVIDNLYKSRINYYVNTHEQNSGHSATGYAKSSNRTGVCMVTSGPGITNMITPLLDAKNDSTPLVVFSGQVSLEAQGKNSFQEAPAVDLTKHVTKWSYQIKDIHEIPYVIDKAFRIANEGKKGSVHIDIPKCVSYQEFNKNLVKTFEQETDNHSTKKTYTKNDFSRIADLINYSKQPIIYLGQGCYDATAYLTYFAHQANIPVTSTIHGCGIFDETHELSLGWCGMHGSAAANYAIQDADLIIALGSRFDDRTTGNIKQYAPKAFEAGKTGKGGIIHVNIEESELDFVVKSHHNFCMDCKDFIKGVFPFIETKKRIKWLNHMNNLKIRYPFEMKRDDYNLHMEDVLDTIYRKTFYKDVMFTTGVGNHQMQAYQFIKSQYPKKILSSGSLGVMGAGLPYSIGAQIANRDKMVINIDGDSSFNMTMSDLKTIQEYKLPVKIAVMNNNAQMMVTIWEKLFFDERYTATLNRNNPKYDQLANSFGIKSLICRNKLDLDSKIHQFINYPGPILCEFNIEKDICLPLVKPGCALDDMLLPESQSSVTSPMTGIAPS